MKSLKFLLIIVITLITSTSLVFPWQAKKTLKALVSSAPLIVTGKVLEIAPQFERHGDQENFIVTYAKLSIQSVLKGTYTEPVLTIKMRGGQIGDRVIGGEQFFQFSEGEEVLLFLSLIDKNIWEIYGISGKLSAIKKDGVKYYDCSMLKADNISQYGQGTYFKIEEIITRIRIYLSEKGGK